MDWDSEYWSAGKLLLTSEYVVIDGAKALAIPCRFGQSLKVKNNHSGKIHWIGKTNTGEVWIECELASPSLDVVSANDDEKAQKLSIYLRSAKELSVIFPTSGAQVETNLDFPRDWGLGSSSTLLTNIAKWLQINPFEFHFAVSNGSGYDIACGMSGKPLIYQTIDQQASFEEIDFDPDFKDHIYFIHLNQKQISDKEVDRYSELKKELNLKEITSIFSGITEEIRNANSLDKFNLLINEHEILMSHALQRDTIKESLFQMYAGGTIKSLGAWGGDFVMVTAQKKEDLEYFKNKGFNTILRFDEMIS